MPPPMPPLWRTLAPQQGGRSQSLGILLLRTRCFATSSCPRLFMVQAPRTEWPKGTPEKHTICPRYFQKLGRRLFSNSLSKQQARRDEAETNHAANDPRHWTDAFEDSRAFRRRLRPDSGGEETVKDVRLGDVARLFALARREMWQLTGAFLLLCVSSTVALCIPYSIGKILDMAVKKDGDRHLFGLTLSQFNVALGSLFLLGASANFGRVFILRVVGERVVARLRSKLYKRTVMQDAEFFDANRVGDLLSRFSSDANIVAKSLTQNIADGLKAVITGTAGLTMMAYISLELTGIIVAVVPPVAVGAYYYGRRIRDITTQSQRTLGNSTKVAEETLNNIKTVQAYSADVVEVRKYNKEVRHIYRIGRREALLSASFFSATNLAGNMTVLTVLSVGTQMVLNNSISMGDLSSFMLYSAYTGSAMIGLSSFYSKMMKGLGAASRVFELEDSKRVVRSTVGIPATKDAKGQIEFKNVTFSYPTRPSSLIFNRLSFIIPPGSNICVVGPSGGGKTTISQLLLRFYDPVEGTITLNGKDIRTFNLLSLRRAIGLVGQDPVLFSGSIADNIAYGKPSATREEIEEAAREANCRFVEDFPQGLDTQVGPRGTQLSGGQKQRIAIARALIRKPSILILDEATSSLDAESEAAVTDALRRIMDSDCTTISISHRLSAIRRSDQVIVLDTHGHVVEQGRFQDLVADENSYFMKVLT
ncbi:P-loop containing nucleoside triphosphate hydrolase protein [Lipomyces orientalis]|uniref:P-loop containing nucleoside triphosphate hydrolase protein n=1 Tax=Lipomyces orientalis TaxID=1233043 RepID=A0ACC3TXJ0_9ASCO